MLRGFNTDRRKRQREREEEVVSPCPSVAPVGAGADVWAAARAAATDTSQAGSPWRAIWGPESWFPEGQSCSCSVPRGASWGKDPSRAGESRPASDAAEKPHEGGYKHSQNDCWWSLSSHDVLITIDGSLLKQRRKLSAKIMVETGHNGSWTLPVFSGVLLPVNVSSFWMTNPLC